MKISKVIKISKTKKQTYDITVENNHNFFCNNHLIHNCGYNGEIKVIVFNTNDETVTVSKGMKIAQAVLCPVVCGKYVSLELTNKVEDKERGNQGFGSTGL